MKCPECQKACKKTTGKHHYTESGMKSVWLLNIPMYECNCGHKLIEIPAFMQLHKVLAEAIIQKPDTLNKEEIKFLRKTLHKNSKELATLLNISPVTVSRWERGKNAISPPYQLLLKTLVYTHYKHILTENALKQIKSGVDIIRKNKTIEMPLPFIAHKALLKYRYANAN